MEANIFLGIALHAIGGLAAATCFVPQKGTKKWSYQSFWLLMCISSWLVMPLIVAYLTVPELAAVISETPMAVKVKMTVLGAAYGFGEMAFAMAIRHQRLIFGGDWPVCNLTSSLSQWLKIAEELIINFNEEQKQDFWSVNATKFYGV